VGNHSGVSSSSERTELDACGEVVDADVTDEAGVKYATGERFVGK